MRKSNSSFVGGLQLLFIWLKLSGHIDWSWWQVLSPVIAVLSLAVILTIAKGEK